MKVASHVGCIFGLFSPSLPRFKKYKTFWRRFWAGIIDGLVFLPIYYLNPFKYSVSLPIINVLWFLFYYTSWYFYSVLLHGRYGQTLGKMVTRVKVIDKAENRRITFKQALMRDSVWIISGLIFIFLMPPDVIAGVNPYDQMELAGTKKMTFISTMSFINMLWFLLEIITMLLNRKRRAIHDFIAGSVIIGKEFVQ